MEQEEIKRILELHEKWLNDEEGGVKANLCGADLRDANLGNADLCGADLSGANLCGADLCNADLGNADLCGADLSGANLCDADLCNADLCRADLHGADLRYANLRSADLHGADLRGANLRRADLSSANLLGANLRNADLCNANLNFSLIDGCIYQLSRIGSGNRMTVFWADEDVIWCGCFTGTFEEWRDKIRKTYADNDNKYRKQYEAALEYFAELAAMDGMARFKEMLERKDC